MKKNIWLNQCGIRVLRLRSEQQGITLLELVVVAALFSGIILATTQIYNRIIDMQQRSTAEQDMQSELKYALNTLLAETQGAKQIAGEFGMGCSCGNGYPLNSKPYYFTINVDSTILCFKNQSDQCVEYSFSSSSLRRNPDNSNLTSAWLKISDGRFYINSAQDRVWLQLTADEADLPEYKFTDHYQHHYYYQTAIALSDYRTDGL